MAGETDLSILLNSMKPELVGSEYVFCTFEDAAYGDYSELEPVAMVQEAEGMTLIIPKTRADAHNLPYASVLRKIGGFDERFIFYFEETDLTRRLAKARFKIAINPKAQVVHSDAESSYRSSRRIPKSLRQLGASWRLFMDKHALATKAEEIRFQLCLQQRERLLKLMKIGWIEPRDVTRMQEEFDRAIVGQFNRSKIKKLTFSASKNFKAFQTKNAPPKTMYGSIWQAKALKRKAKSIADSGVPTHLFIFSRTSLFHHRAFDQDGYWIQKGGLFGRAARSETLFKKYNFEKRLEKERHRIAIDTGFEWGAGG